VAELEEYPRLKSSIEASRCSYTQSTKAEEKINLDHQPAKQLGPHKTKAKTERWSRSPNDDDVFAHTPDSRTTARPFQRLEHP
jgi:hypothetical protein